ncbi:histone deacetylase family protein [Pseudidiomarina sp.]|uniref:histone deacetylase family protein n=1 Tax=Pseudidiomarina sp. TaxID=2081707 RepID=UPI003A985C7B
MKAFLHDDQKCHYPKDYLVNGVFVDNPEHPARIDHLKTGALAAGCEFQQPKNSGLGPISAVHTPEYLHFLQHAHRRWSYIEGASEAVVADIRPVARDGAYPASVVAQAGYHMSDAAAPIGADTWTSACWSAWTAVAAADAVLAGDTHAFALCRPPGHHASAEVAGGFCYFNNSAIAAVQLQQKYPRVAILDVDLHHGNGTQQIFYKRDDVFTVSIHADPVRFYPFFWGHADERGEGRGLGYNLNLPLPRQSDDKVFLKALNTALARIEAFAPDALVIALGIDASIDDPIGGLAVSTDGFHHIGQTIKSAFSGPTVIVQEGGYISSSLAANLTAFLRAYTQK